MELLKFIWQPILLGVIAVILLVTGAPLVLKGTDLPWALIALPFAFFWLIWRFGKYFEFRSKMNRQREKIRIAGPLIIDLFKQGKKPDEVVRMVCEKTGLEEKIVISYIEALVKEVSKKANSER